ncbi:uncharacterized protein [Hyperolius riggenbachi]
MAAMVGSKVNLRCHLEVGSDEVTETNLYWYMPGEKENTQWFLYPDVSPQISKIFNKNSAVQSNQNSKTDMSLTVTNISLSHTGTYVCHTSLRTKQNQKKRSISGTGTYLLLHEPLEVGHNGSDIVCRTNVQKVQHVTLLWQFDGTDFRDGDHTWGNNPTGYWISNRFLNWTSQCQATENVTISCCLQYMGRTLMNESVEVPCTGPPQEPPHDPPHPLHLYGLIFACNVLILIIILLVWIRRRRRHRKGSTDTPYMNLAKFKKGVNM